MKITLNFIPHFLSEAVEASLCYFLKNYMYIVYALAPLCMKLGEMLRNDDEAKYNRKTMFFARSMFSLV
jgi:hypothetical protein